MLETQECGDRPTSAWLCLALCTAAGSALLKQPGEDMEFCAQPFGNLGRVRAVLAGGALVRPANTPKPGWILGFELSPIFNFHLGPGVKIRGRGGK